MYNNEFACVQCTLYTALHVLMYRYIHNVSTVHRDEKQPLLM